ncbi:TIGR00733: oligopeptide transporter, OPT family [Rubrobacter radiotolerans]|uniref:Oligopeptide transporter, OPT family n=1 Tax=Rubrobacter radiotolerans TaxID=42256 RepID=A0A023WZP6_RUBRA|nr:oligopeptide transporter, OPT family [Rubrobacter radiotolerans]AHY45692.1 TIGR00733: oligopeptide transporter, OPT family [Rubrobacter radiotolerans]MDX5893106.1 oligopeptide transporter, OPT family [Rubrobacter radiotolerans]SMC03066.1 putative oligopeptide transporter, OPT family [Rubrobacter radiotolerans DSM 5868]
MAQTDRRAQDTNAVDEPYVPAARRLPEITLKALLLAVVLAVVLAGANAYLGLKVGLTVSASIPAAVISMAILRFFRESNILENNIVQTAASSGEALAAGVIFTLPALVILRYWQGFEWLPVMAVAITGGILGVMFTIPLRRALILQTRLKFPEGVATGEVLKVGAEGGRGAKTLALAAGAAAVFKLCQTGFGVAASAVSGAVAAGGAIFAVGSGLAVALLGVGYIVGLNIAVLVFMGGAISWFIGIPLYMVLAGPDQVQTITQGAAGYEAALAVWSERIRYLGVGAMAVGGVWALVSLAGPVRDGVRSSVDAMRRARSGEEGGLARTEQDTPINFVLYGALAMVVPIFLVFLFVVDQDALGISGGLYFGTIIFGVVFAFLAGFLFSSVAAYMAGLVGSSNNPVSGVTIATILAISLILLGLLGTQVDFGVDAGRATSAAATAILVGGVVCCAAAIGGDNLQDLKAGHIVGSTPFKQQIMQIVGVVAAALAIAPILSVLYQAYGLGGVFPREGMDPAEALTAPQATLMASVSEGVFAGGLPWGMFGIGCALAAAIIVADRVLEARESGFRMPVLAVAVGLYLPIELSVPIFVGGIVAALAGRALSSRRAALGDDFDQVNLRAARRGLLFASGLITGEALMGILLAIPFAAAQTTDVFALGPEVLGLGEGVFGVLVNALGVAAFIFFALWLYRVASAARG